MQALGDPDPRVQLQAITGLKRLGAVDAAKAMLPLTASTDLVVANVAINALVALSAVDAALGGAERVDVRRGATGALRVLQQIARPPAVTGLDRGAGRTRERPSCAPASCRRWRGCTIATACGAARWPNGGARGPIRPVRTTIRSPGKRARASCRFCARRS